MRLKGSDCVRKSVAKTKRCENPLPVGSGLCKSGNLSNCNVPIAWIHRIKNRVWDRVSVWIFHSSFEKRIIETNNKMNIAIINFKLLFHGVRLTWLTTATSVMMEGAAEYLIDSSENRICRLKFELLMLLKGAVMALEITDWVIGGKQGQWTMGERYDQWNLTYYWVVRVVWRSCACDAFSLKAFLA